jgi:hypothetical protein
LPLGAYEVTATLEGFGQQVQRGFELGVGQTLTLTFRLRQAAVSEQIVVTAAAPPSEFNPTAGTTRIDE